MVSELTIILKDDSRTYRQKFLLHNTYAVHEQDETILSCLIEAKKNFDGNPTDIIVKISLTIQ